MTKELRWKVEEYVNDISARSIRVVDEDGKVICDNEPYYPQAIDPKHARLIAAAPDMLEALKMAQLWLDTDGRFDMQAINAAISKAEGRSP